MNAILKPAPAPDDAATASLLDKLVDALIKAKADEAAANAHRVRVEEQILALVPPKDEGSVTHTLGSGLKLTVTQKLYIKCSDVHQLRQQCKDRLWPDSLVPIKSVEQLDEAGVKWLRKEEPNLYRQIAEYLTITPAKPALSIKV